MGGGNGMKSAMARDKAAKKAGTNKGSEQAANKAAQTIQCTVCKQTFQSTTKPPQLLEHAQNKHSKGLECFPGVSA